MILQQREITKEKTVDVDGTEYHITFKSIQLFDPESGETTDCKDPAAGNYNPGATYHNQALCWYYGAQGQSE